MYNAYVRVLDDKITGFKTATAGVDSAPSAIGLHGGLAQIIYIRTIEYICTCRGSRVEGWVKAVDKMYIGI